jgi:hypothetical protein
MITRRRETHLRGLGVSRDLTIAPPPKRVRPRLRVEPAPTYYLRTARAYAFVGNLLNATFGAELENMYGQREIWTYGQIRQKKLSERDDDLATELAFMRRLLYGLYLVSCEDIGMKPELAPGEKVDLRACKQAALNWSQTFRRDPDLKPDARVCVPVHVDREGRAKFWAVAGVRLARLEAEYVHPPSIREPGGKWSKADPGSLGKSTYLIPVDAFAAFTLKGAALARREFWDALAMAGTRDAFLEAIRRAGTRERLLEMVAEHRRKQLEESEE